MVPEINWTAWGAIATIVIIPVALAVFGWTWERVGSLRLLRWGAFESWRDAADVAFKIVGAVVAIAALNLLTVRADVQTSTTCEDGIDEARVRSSYASAGESIPPTVIRFVRDWNNNGDILPLLAPRDPLLAVPISRCLSIGLFEISPTSTGLQDAISLDALSLAASEDDRLTAAELQRATEVIADARSLDVHVRVVNVGRADAVDVSVVTPAGFVQTAGPTEPFTLASAAQRDATFHAEGNAGRFVSTDFEPVWSSLRVVDVRAVTLLAGVLLVVLWLPFVVVGVMTGPKRATRPRPDLPA